MSVKIILSQHEIAEACREWVEAKLVDRDADKLVFEWIFDGDEPDEVRMAWFVPTKDTK